MTSLARLAADGAVPAKTGRVLRVSGLAREHGFTGVDGRRGEAFALGEPGATQEG